jgi:steroid delta-isomerase-like uncharacterized protein
MNGSLARKISEANEALIAEWRVERIPDFFAEDYVAHLTDRDMAGGHDAVRRYLEMVRRAFPKVQVEVQVLMEGDDIVAWQRTLEGVQEGAFAGFPALGRKVVWRDMVVSRFRGGRIAEEWVVTDLAERLLLSRKVMGHLR